MSWFGRRLQRRVFVALVAVSLAWALGLAVLVRATFVRDGRLPVRIVETVRVVGADLPTTGVDLALDDVAERLDVRASLWSADGRLIARSGGPLPPPNLRGADEVGFRGPSGPGIAVRLDDGRVMAVAPRGDRELRPRFLRFLLVLGAMAGVAGVGSWLVSRRITRRLESLGRAVDGLGAGDLTARVAVDGDDEVGDLARSFNAAAGRIEALVGGQRRMIASASHELRSPLARLRLALELIGDGDPSKQALITDAARDIEELDGLVGDLLLASRLEAVPLERAPVDLLALAEEEAARVGATVSGGPVLVPGDAKALRHLLRNLLENAKRHGAPPITLTITSEPGRVRITVADGGPGVAPDDRERVWEPFWRAAGSREGSGGGVGLGLALVRQVARLHGGDATYEPGPPSAFVVLLKIASLST